MSYANFKCTVRYMLEFTRDQFGREGPVNVTDNAIPRSEGKVVAICPNELTATKVRQALEGFDGRDWVRKSNAALEAAKEATKS